MLIEIYFMVHEDDANPNGWHCVWMYEGTWRAIMVSDDVVANDIMANGPADEVLSRAKAIDIPKSQWQVCCKAAWLAMERQTSCQ